jgi:hypothetical protein
VKLLLKPPIPKQSRLFADVQARHCATSAGCSAVNGIKGSGMRDDGRAFSGAGESDRRDLTDLT